MDKVLLSKATSPDDDPIPGYVLSEIARNTIDNPQVCGDLEGYLLNKLKKPNHNVKYKTLLIIKHVCRNGHSDFKKDISRNLDSVRSCLQYKGPPDPLRGDEIYKRVREMAKDAIDAVYDNQTNISSIAITNRIQGIGSNDIYNSNHSNNNYSSDTSPRPTGAISYLQSVGGAIGSRASWLRNKDDTVSSSDTGYIGNLSSTPQPSTSNSFLAARSQSLSNPVIPDNGVSSVAYGNDYNERERERWEEWNTTTTSNGSLHKPFSDRKPSMASSDELHFISNRGPHAVVSSADGMYNASAILPGAWQQQPNMQSGGAGTGSSLNMVGRAGVAASDGSYEKSIVDGLCPPGGLKPVPPQDKLDSFLESAPTLSAELIGSCLLEQLNSDHWTSRVKALLVIDALFSLRTPGNSNSNHHETWWRERLDEIEAIVSGDAKSSVRTQAARLVKHIASVSETSSGSNSGELGSISKSYDAGRDKVNSTNGSLAVSNSPPAQGSSNNNALTNLLDLASYSEVNCAESGPVLNSSSSSGRHETQIPITSSLRLHESNSRNSSSTYSQYQGGRPPEEVTADLFAGMSLKTPPASLPSSASNDLGSTGSQSNSRSVTAPSPSLSTSLPSNTLDFLSDVQTGESDSVAAATASKIINHQTVHAASPSTTTTTTDYLSELSSLSNTGRSNYPVVRGGYPSPSDSPHLPSGVTGVGGGLYGISSNSNSTALPAPPADHLHQPYQPYPSYVDAISGLIQGQAMHHHPANYPPPSGLPFARYPMHQGQGQGPAILPSQTHQPPYPYHHIPIHQNVNNGGAMVLPTSVRKSIPDPASITATSSSVHTQPGSGFSFLATESGGSKEDSFSFVTDVIKASKK